MTLSELITEVYAITNRPDLVTQTSSAVRAATLKIHQSDFYYKDIKEQGIAFTTPLYEQQLDYRTLLPYFRAIKYLRKTDAAGSSNLLFFEIIPPELILDEYNLERTDIAYVAGTNIQIKSSTQFQYAILGYYENPNITLSGYNSWVALDHPFAIIFEAAAQIFKQTGDTDQFTVFTQYAREQLGEVKMSNILPVGY